MFCNIMSGDSGDHWGDVGESWVAAAAISIESIKKCLNAKLAAVIVKPPRELRGATPGPRASRFGVRFQVYKLN